MKRVLMVADNGLGRAGVPAVIMSIIRGLKDEYQFDLVLFTKEVRHYEAEVLSYGCRIFRVPMYEGTSRFLKKINYYIRGSRLYWGIRRCIEENGPYDVIHCHKTLEGSMCLKAAAEAGIPVRVIHTHQSVLKTGGLRGWINSRYLKLLRRYATHKVACSPSAGESVYGQGGEVIAVYNAYDETHLDPNKYPRTKRALNLIQIGSYSDNKNQLFTLEVLAALRNRGADAKLHFVGFGDFCQKVEERTAELGLAEHVCFHEAGADIPALLSESAACLFPSKREGFGIVQVEAQAMGVRCYVSDTVPKDADVGGCCFLPLDCGADKWAEKILSDYQESDGLPGEFDCSAFTTESITENYRKIYRGEMLLRQKY